jgi:hypothetical protein
LADIADLTNGRFAPKTGRWTIGDRSTNLFLALPPRGKGAAAAIGKNPLRFVG